MITNKVLTASHWFRHTGVAMAIPLQFGASMHTGAKPDFFSVELEGRPIHAYNESAFRYFLSIEQKRSGRSGRPFALLLVQRKAHASVRKGLAPEIATRLFAGLSLCLRDTDFIGWFEDGVVAGAVLTHLGAASGSDITPQVRQRVNHTVLQGLLPELAEQLALRIYQLPAQEHELGENRS